MASSQNLDKKFSLMLSDSKIRLSDFSYNQKKGRKKSAPKPTLTVSFSPDGAIIVLVISNLGSFSFIKFLMNFESENWH
jgi:hypothetical protein